MASQISVQKIVEPNSWLVLGAPTATSVVLLNDTTITYSDGTSDLLPANTEALLVGGGTSFDRSTDVYVLFVYKGDAVLRVQKESSLFLLTQDYAPLGRILHGEIVAYQPVPALLAATLLTGSWSGGALIGVGRAITGGGYYGHFLSQSIKGGGSVSGLAFAINVGGQGGCVYGNCGLFLKVAGAPGGDTTVFDFDFGVSGYFRLKLTSTLHLVLETSFLGASSTLDIVGSAISTGVWYWVWCGTTGTGGAGARLVGQAWSGGTSPGAQYGGGMSTSPGGGCATYTATFGLGVTQSSGYADWPNSAGNELSKFAHHNSGFSGGPDPFGPPTSDMSPSGLEALYLCRDAAGSSICLDSTSNNYDLTPGPNGLVVVADGPYV